MRTLPKPKLRVANTQEIWRFVTPRANNRTRNLPPIAGGAGWAINQHTGTEIPSGGGTTGISVAFASNVTAGDVVIAAGMYNNPGNFTPTASDAATTPN